jgi:recombination protein RecT
VTDTSRDQPDEIPPPPGTAVATIDPKKEDPRKPKSAEANFQEQLSLMEEQIRKVLPPHVTIEKFARIVLTAVKREPKLLQADRRTLFDACLACAADGLMPDGREAVLVHFTLRDKGLVAAYMPMVAGILKKVRNSGELKNLLPEVVYERDKFRYWVDNAGPHIEHEPLLDGERGKVRCSYAIAITHDGGTYIEVINEKQMNDIRKCSRGNNGPWSGSFADEMRKKSTIRRLSKRLPMSTDVEQVIRRDDEFYELEHKPAHETGLAAELNKGALSEGSESAEGDRLESLRDLRESPSGSVSREDLECDADRRGVEHGADVPPASRDAAPAGMAADGERVPAPRGRPPAKGVGDRARSFPADKGDPRAR